MARAAGALEIVVTDIDDAPLEYAKRVGADKVINMLKDEMELEKFAAGKGYFDVLFGCWKSGFFI